ncbi:MAG TPA: pilus assembly protein CpaE [Rhizomicrobium sp.]|jgi:pilus assembly protein CpaE|nr:pilus assembly protein CpaE [Rhizomicrobium sp.]
MTMHAPETEPFGAKPHERPVPRISIHAFVEFPDTGAALQRAAADRRLSRAQLNVELGGIEAAIEHFKESVTPNLLIVETRLSGQAALEELDKLAHVCDPASRVIVVGRVNDVELYRELMKRGASEYLVAPLNPMHLIEVVSGLYLEPGAAPIGRIVTFFGARGGVGSSSLSHNVGFCIADEFEISTTIVDFDLPFGTAGLDFNDEPGQGVADALAAPERLDDVLLDRLLTKRGDHLSLFTAPATLERDFEAGPDAFEAVLEAVRQSTPCIVVDLPHMWTPWVKATLVGSDEIILVATPDLASLRNAKSILEALKHNRPNDAPPKLVLNQIGQPKRPEIPAKDFAETLGVEPVCSVNFDPVLFGQAANNGQMLIELQANAPSSAAIRQLAQIVTGRAPQTAEKPQPSILSFLSKGKKRA